MIKTLALLFSAISICHGQTDCLPQSVIEVPISVRMLGRDITNLCSNLEMNDFTTMLQNLIIDQYQPQEESFGCRILEVHHISCEAVEIRRKERANVKYLANLTCSDSCAYVDATTAAERYSTKISTLRTAMRTNLKVITAIGDLKIIIHYFRGRKGVVLSQCIAGAVGRISNRLELCRCPSDCFEQCTLPPETGVCKALFPRFFHNSTSRQCESFIYGGCGGNGNNFQTLEECQQHCNVCPSGKMFQECGTACPRTCDNKDDFFTCTFQCVRGCVCPDATVLNEEEDLCVAPEACPVTEPDCPKGMEFLTCGSACPTTCDNMANMDELSICTLQCVQGCFCVEGLIFNEANRTCVAPEACPVTEPDCPEDMEFLTCGSACPTTCANKDELFICSLPCVRGCLCVGGKILNEADNTCVGREECPDTGL